MAVLDAQKKDHFPVQFGHARVEDAVRVERQVVRCKDGKLMWFVKASDMGIARDMNDQPPGATEPPVGQETDRPQARTRVHWHVAFTHFPISLFGTAFLFQVLHLFMFQKPFEVSTTVCILAGAGSLIPASVSGWLTWKRHYHGARTWIFRRKIALAVSMLVVSFPLAIWRVTLYYLGKEDDLVDHYVFFSLCTFLVAAAIAEGYYGGRLSHK